MMEDTRPRIKSEIETAAIFEKETWFVTIGRRGARVGEEESRKVSSLNAAKAVVALVTIARTT